MVKIRAIKDPNAKNPPSFYTRMYYTLMYYACMQYTAYEHSGKQLYCFKPALDRDRGGATP